MQCFNIEIVVEEKTPLTLIQCIEKLFHNLCRREYECSGKTWGVAANTDCLITVLPRYRGNLAPAQIIAKHRFQVAINISCTNPIGIVRSINKIFRLVENLEECSDVALIPMR